MNIQDILQKIRYFIFTSNIQTLIGIPIMLGFICFGSIFFTGPSYTGLPAQKILISLGCLCWAMSGIPKIVRQESDYGPIHFYGVLAVIDGTITVILSLMLASLPIIFLGRL